jgi:plastocyanin
MICGYTGLNIFLNRTFILSILFCLKNLNVSEMKNYLNTTGIVLLAGLFMIVYSCTKTNEPAKAVLTTAAVTDISETGAVSGGNITDDAGSDVTARGVCWGTIVNPTVGGTHSTDGTGIGTFSSTLTGLTAGTVYYLKAYATNSAGTSYGDEVTFTTNSSPLPVLTTTAVTSVTGSAAVSGGNITDDRGGNITERGVCWSTVINPTISDSRTSDGTGKGEFISNLTNLAGATKYYVRAYATNSFGTSYGNEVNFTTMAAPGPNEVWIDGMAFIPETITVTVGTTIKWTNKDGVSHTVTSTTPGSFDSGIIPNNGTYSLQFNTTGTFSYYCTIHTSMTGTVIVQ